MMTHIVRNTVLGAAVAAMTMAAVAPAQADHRRHRHGDAVAAGIAGLAIGAIVGGALSQPRSYDRVYIDPPYPAYRPAPVYNYRYVEPDYYPAPSYRTTVRTRVIYGSPEPWTREWYRACDARYRSFDPRSGTFMGYDGRRHFCNP